MNNCIMDESLKPSRYCWRTPFKVLGVPFLRKVSPAFLPSKKVYGTDKVRHFWVRQQYPCWVGTRRVALPYVSSCPPLKTVRTTFMVYGLAPAVILRDPRSVPSHFASSTGLHPWTACAFAGYLCSGLSAG